MYGRLAVELGCDRLLDKIFPLDDAAQNRFDHLVAALVGRHIGEPHFVVEFLLGHIVRADMSDNLSHNGRALPVSCRSRPRTIAANRAHIVAARRQGLSGFRETCSKVRS